MLIPMTLSDISAVAYLSNVSNSFTSAYVNYGAIAVTKLKDCSRSRQLHMLNKL